MSDPDRGVEAWMEHTSAFDRVRSIAAAVSTPKSASEIADEAHVAEPTAREHLERLVDLTVLLKTDQDGTTVYAPDPLHTRMQAIRELLDAHDWAELIDLKADLQEELDTLRDAYQADSPDQLRACAAETDDAAEKHEIMGTASDWELTRYHLDILEEAIENYTRYTRDFQSRSHPDSGTAGPQDRYHATSRDAGESLFEAETDDCGE